MPLFFIGLESLGMLLLRLALGAVFLKHGWSKLKNPQAVAKGMSWPLASAVLLGLAETIGGALTILGFFTQIGALLIAIVMLGALYHHLFIWKTPFSSFQKCGWEFDLILLATALALLFIGGGSMSLDFSWGIA